MLHEQIRDGDSDMQLLIGRYCGSSTYPDVVSSTGKLFIHFSSDGDAQRFGFQLSLATFMCKYSKHFSATAAVILTIQLTLDNSNNSCFSQ